MQNYTFKDSEKIVKQLNRATISDGKLLKKYIADPLSSRDETLLKGINEIFPPLSEVYSNINAHSANDYANSKLTGFSAIAENRTDASQAEIALIEGSRYAGGIFGFSAIEPFHVDPIQNGFEVYYRPTNSQARSYLTHALVNNSTAKDYKDSIVFYKNASADNGLAVTDATAVNCSIAMYGSTATDNSLAYDDSWAQEGSVAMWNSRAHNHGFATHDSVVNGKYLYNNGGIAMWSSLANDGSIAMWNSTAQATAMALWDSTAGNNAVAEHQSYAYFSAVAMWNSNANRNAVALYGSTASNNAVAMHASTAEQQAVAMYDSSASNSAVALYNSTASTSAVAMHGSYADTNAVAMWNSSATNNSVAMWNSTANNSNGKAVALINSKVAALADNARGTSIINSYVEAGGVAIINSTAKQGGDALINSTATDNSVAVISSYASYESVAVNNSQAAQDSFAMLNSYAYLGSIAIANSTATNNSIALCNSVINGHGIAISDSTIEGNVSGVALAGSNLRTEDKDRNVVIKMFDTVGITKDGVLVITHKDNRPTESYTYSADSNNLIIKFG